MKLYEINSEIERILAALEPDEETGEIVANEEELLDALDGLEMERADILRYIAKCVLNERADVGSVTAEIERLKKKKDRAEARAERLTAILDRECNGKKTDLGVATLSYRKSSAVVIDDENAVINWLNNTRDYMDAYRVEYKISKTLLKRAIDDASAQGTAVDGAHIETRTSASLR